MSVSSNNLANIVRQGAYLGARRLSHLPQILRKKDQTLLGKDKRSGGLHSMLGGSFDEEETNPYQVAVRESRDEGGHQLFFILLNDMPQMFYTDALTGKVLDAKKHSNHPKHPEYTDHPTVLRFVFDVLEISGENPTDCDPSEITDIAWRDVDLTNPGAYRISTFHGLSNMKWNCEPKLLRHLNPNFQGMYQYMRDELNVPHDQAHTWSNHQGTEVIQEGQPFEQLLRLLDKKWTEYTAYMARVASPV